MKASLRFTLSLAGTAVLAALLVLVSGAAAGQRHLTTCKGLEVTILDSLERNFVSPGDVKRYMEDYGDYIGQRIDSVNLCRIEDLLDGRSAIRKSEAYVTRDGMLHIDITQRDPAVRFHTGGNGFYADESGFLFPLQSKFTARVPIVDGAVPVTVPKGFKGRPEDPKEQQWLEEVLSLIRYLGRDKTFKDAFSQITVLRGGELILIPRTGQERFLFGQPRGFAEKFERIRTYCEAIAPSRDPGAYRKVDVRYDRQIICSK